MKNTSRPSQLLKYIKLNQFLVFLFSVCLSHGQSLQEVSEINVIPPSPNVADFNKYVDIPVSQYTGTPNISIPIYTIDLPQIQLPISLSYHASGLRVEEHASWVGAGWTLQAGGNISRTVRGLPDEVDNNLPRKGWFTSDASRMFDSQGYVIAPINCTTVGAVTFDAGHPVTLADTLRLGWIDTEPDVYQYNHPGGSGKFIFSRDRNVYMLTDDNSVVTTHPFTSSTLPNIPLEDDYVWKMTGPDGTIYEFEQPEKTTVTSQCGSSESLYGGGLDYYQSSWLLTKIKNNSDSITFSYTMENLSYDQRISSTSNHKTSGDGTPPSGETACANDTDVKAYRLDTIKASNGVEIIFVATTDRLDLTGSKRLEKIKVEQVVNGTRYFLKSFKLKTDYFGSNDKLKLEEFYPTDELDSAENGYIFEYHSEIGFPSMTSKAQDFWGYYNGASNSSLIPEYKDDKYHINRTSNANRFPNLNKARIGTLSKMIYPTGGSAEFVYELHDYYADDKKITYTHAVEADGTDLTQDVQTRNFSVSQDCRVTLDFPGQAVREGFEYYLKKWNGSSYQITTLNPVLNGHRHYLDSGAYQLYALNAEDTSVTSLSLEYEQLVPGDSIVGGLRIAQIKNHSGSNTTYRNFEYRNGSSQSSGVLFSPLLFKGTEKTHQQGELVGPNCSVLGEYKYITLSSSSSLPMAAYQGSHIGYSDVKEYASVPLSTERVGYKTYSFVNSKGFVNTGFPYVPSTDLSYKNGKILSETTYKTVNDSTDAKVNETLYAYTVDTLSTEFLRGFKVDQVRTRFCHTCFASDYIINGYAFQRIFYALTKVTNTNYFDTGAISTETLYEYNNTPTHTFFSAKTEIAAGDTIRQSVTRLSGSPALITNESRTINDPANPLEPKMISGQSLTYHGKLPLNYSVWNRDTDSYHLEVANEYDDGRLITTKRHFGNTGLTGDQLIETNYVWGYNNSHPVAKVDNATRTQIDATLTSSDLTSLKNGTNIESIIQKLRDTISGAHVTTYEYKVGIGPSKQFDVNQKKTSYSYDDFGRLVEVRNHDNEILQQFQYNYQSQVSN